MLESMAKRKKLAPAETFQEFEAGTHKPKTGRPLTIIDWDQFDKLCSYHCTQQEIADFFECSLDTLERAAFRDLGIRFAELWQQKKGKHRVALRKMQFDIARQGNTGMAIFLGKQILGQSDKPLDEAIMEAVQKAGLTKDQAIELIMGAQQKALTQDKKTFEQFCVDAGYPHPYPKQIEMMDFGMADPPDARLLLGSRGYGKTDYVVILGIAYSIYVYGTEPRYFIITKSKERNTAMINEIRAACEKNGVIFEKANSTTLRVAGLLGKDASVSMTTLKSVSLRGRHPTMTIMDDPVTPDDASEATRLLVKRVYNEINKLCIKILIIGQPVHKFDLYADLRPLLRKMEVPHGTIPELDHDLEAQRLAGVDEASIQASYFLNVVAEGSTPFDKINLIDQMPMTPSSVAFIDPSHEGGDYTAISIVTQYGQGIAVEGYTWKKSWDNCIDDMAPIIARLNVQKVCFETNALGQQPLMLLRKAFPDVGVVGKRSNTNKHSRIMAAGTFAPLIHLSKRSDQNYKDQVIKYEYKSKYDDAPDSLASCLEWIGLVRGKD